MDYIFTEEPNEKTLTYAVAAIMACAGLVLILGLFDGRKTSALRKTEALLIAHRGYSSLYVENSLKAFEAVEKQF